MKHHTVNAFAATVLFSLGTTAFAAGPYIGLNYSQYELTNSSTTSTLKPTGATVRAGIDFTSFLALEGRAGVGVNSDERGPAEFDLDRLYGGYLKLSVPIAGVLSPYAIAGYSEVRGKASVLGVSATETYSDESYGVGVDASVAGVIGLNVEYMRYLDENNSELNAVSVGVRSSF